jgi:hypothetical protein
MSKTRFLRESRVKALVHSRGKEISRDLWTYLDDKVEKLIKRTVLMCHTKRVSAADAKLAEHVEKL